MGVKAHVSMCPGNTWNLTPETWNLRRGSAERLRGGVRLFAFTLCSRTYLQTFQTPDTRSCKYEPGMDSNLLQSLPALLHPVVHGLLK